MGLKHITSSDTGELDIYFTVSVLNKYFNKFLDTVLQEYKYCPFWPLEFNMCNLLFSTALHSCQITINCHSTNLLYNSFSHSLLLKKEEKKVLLCGLMGSCAYDNLKITWSQHTRIWVKAAWRKKDKWGHCSYYQKDELHHIPIRHTIVAACHSSNIKQQSEPMLKAWNVAGVCVALKWTLPLHGNSDEEIETNCSTMSTAELLTLVLHGPKVTEWTKVDWSLISCFCKEDMEMQHNWKEKHLTSIKKNVEPWYEGSDGWGHTTGRNSPGPSGPADFALLP